MKLTPLNLSRPSITKRNGSKA
uniref:Uncharacterized protein n=1 Tax=Rhizophora mucronata TaxID=61149 RepID=A0A2P2NK33_RHIMU